MRAICLFLGVFSLLSCTLTRAQSQYTAAARPVEASHPTFTYPTVMVNVTDIDEDSIPPVVAKLREFTERGDKKVMLRLNTFGGSIFAGLTLIQELEELKKGGVRVVCVADSKAYSMGFAILESCDDRLMTKRATLLAHNGSTQAQGDANKISETADMVRALSHGLAQVCAARLHMTVEAYEAKIETRAWIMDQKEALDVGAVDSIVDPMDLPPVVEAPKTDSLFGKLFGPKR